MQPSSIASFYIQTEGKWLQNVTQQAVESQPWNQQFPLAGSKRNQMLHSDAELHHEQQQQKPRARWGIRLYYDRGWHSEGNRFITNDEL